MDLGLFTSIMTDWQEKIQAAKREGEQLKEKIRQKKEDLNDADRNSPSFPPPFNRPTPKFSRVLMILNLFSVNFSVHQNSFLYGMGPDGSGGYMRGS